MDKFLKYETPFGNVDVCFELGRYVLGNNLAIEVLFVEGGELEPYTTLSVNLKGSALLPDEAIIDTNNNSSAEKFIRQNHLGKKIPGRVFQSGFCTYPLYKMDMEKLKEYCVNPEFFEEELK